MKQNLFFIKVIVRISLPIIVFLFANFCISAQNAKWTIMIYLDADNDLENVAITDFNEMESVGSTDSVNIIVQFDRVNSYDNTNGDWTDTRRFRVLQDDNPALISTEPVEIIGEKNMGDPQVLTEFINWTVSNYPADRYALVLWNHGGGWRLKRTDDNNPFTRDVCYDITSNDYLSNYEVGKAISESNINPDIIAFDACLMGMIEVAYQLRDLADIFVASEDAIPWDGFDYEAFLYELVNDHNMTADTLSSVIVRTYGEYYDFIPVTIASLKLNKIRDIARKLDSLTIKIINNGSIWDEVGQARYNTQSFDVYDYFDLWSLANLIETYITDTQIKDAALSLKNVIDDAMIDNYASDDYNYARGLSIYFPLFENYDPEYGDRLFSKDFPDSTRWINFLSEFYNNYSPDLYEPNNHFANATSAYNIGSANGLLKALGDIDIYAFYYNGVADASAILVPPANFDIFLYSVQDTLIHQLDSSKNSGTISDTIVISGFDPGIYYIVIKPVETSDNPYELMFYNLSSLIEENTPLTLAYDDGYPQYQFYSNEADKGIGMRFEGVGDLQGVWYYITDLDVEEGSGDLGLLNLHIYDYYFMEELWEYEPVTAQPGHKGWNYVDLSDQEIEFYSDDIIIGFTWDGDNTPALGIDSAFSDYNSFYYTDYSWDLINDSALFFIRPVFSLYGEEAEDTCYCNEFTHLTENSGLITDGSEEHDYTNNSECSWLISTVEPASISLTFTEFDTEEFFDYIIVYDGDNPDAPQIGVYSGILDPFTVMSTGGAMYIVFYSDESITSAGWRALYSIESNICYCQEFTLLTEPAGSITDGSGALDYGNNTDCIWLIQLAQNRNISLQFTEFNLEGGNDSVIIYDGSTTNANVISRLTGLGHSNILTSSGNSMIIKFNTNNSIVAGGWECEYSSSVISNTGTFKTYSVEILPNPGEGKINISFPSGYNSSATIVIINSAGNIISTETIQSGISYCALDISEYPAGLYFLKITYGTSYAVKKYIKK